MNTNIVSATEVQRNFRQVLERLQSSKEPIIVIRDSKPTAVMLPYLEYKRYISLEKDILKTKMEAIWKDLYAKNKNIPEKEIESDIEEALRNTRGY